MGAKSARTGKGAGVRYHHGDLRAALVAEARNVVERDGPDRLSLRGVAEAAGVSAAAPYHHFADKHALLAAVIAEGFREFTQTMRARAEGAAGPQERLGRLGLGYVEFGIRHPHLFRLMQGPAFQQADANPDLRAAQEESFTLLAEAVVACLPGAGEEQKRAACAAAWSLVHGMATLCNDGRLRALIDTNDLERAVPLITNQLDITRVLEPDPRSGPDS